MFEHRVNEPGAFTWCFLIEGGGGFGETREGRGGGAGWGRSVGRFLPVADLRLQHSEQRVRLQRLLVLHGLVSAQANHVAQRL